MADDGLLPWRVFSFWQPVDGDVLFTDQLTVLTSDEMLRPTPESRLGQFVDLLVDLKFNVLDLRYYEPEHREALAVFSPYVKSRGMRMVIGRQWTELEHGRMELLPVHNRERQRTSKLLCPFNPQVRRFWKESIARDFDQIPDLGGICFGATTEYYYGNGAPWMCDCDQCSAISRRERLIVALNFLGELLANHDAILIWNSHQDDPWGQRSEVELYSDLTGHIPDNVLVIFSDIYFDQQPGWPRGPMYDHVKPPVTGRAPYLARVQLPGQYRGTHLFAASMVEDWAETFDYIRRLKLSGLWVFGFINRTEWDHPWNMSHWYGISRYVADPDVTPQQILSEWATQTYGLEAAPAVVEMIRLSYPAAIKLFTCEGLMSSSRSQLAALTYMDSHMCGPYRQMARVPGNIGTNFPLDMYPLQRAEKIKTDPNVRLIFTSEPITAAHKDRAMAEKDEAIQLIDRMIGLWRSVGDKVDPSIHTTLMDRLQNNRVDAMVFKAALDLYFDWKLGTLTNTRIDHVIAEFNGLHGGIIPDPSGPPPTHRRSSEDDITRNLRSFAEEIRRDMVEPWIEKHFKANPLSSGIVPESSETQT